MVEDQLRSSAVSEQGKKSLKGRTLYIPRMSYEGARLMSAAFQSIGVDAEPLPEPNWRTLELGRKYTLGDECYPQQVTLGGCLQALEHNGVDPTRVAFFMATSGGPCRFGQYSGYLEKVLRQMGMSDVLVFSPGFDDDYGQIDEAGAGFRRTAWRAIVSSDIVRKLLFKTRPYETTQGDSDRAYVESLDDLCNAMAARCTSAKIHLAGILDALKRMRQRFRAVPAKYDRSRPLIGVVGEIYCRLDNFANEEIIRIIERQGGEAWISDIAEWLWYVTWTNERSLIDRGRQFSGTMLGSKLKQYFQRSDEHAMMRLFKDDFIGYEEPDDITTILNYSLPYLPHYGALGEMTLSVGRSIYLYRKGADGVIDVSPFTCMNGIVCESVYPKVSKDHDDMPMKVFYFDGTRSDWERDIGIFIELSRNYQRNKAQTRVFPAYFDAPVAS